MIIGRSPMAARQRRDGFGVRTRRAVQASGAAEAVGALVGDGPEELVDQVGVGAVQLDAVEAEALCVGGGVGIGLRHVDDVGFGGFIGDLLALSV
jgi:hypothetical protein